ncbi:Rv3654c family TadE-like protein [Amnibacterium flavum]|nr:Rv3654c family TadE-like protein [Amnibacterium flavum]
MTDAGAGSALIIALVAAIVLVAATTLPLYMGFSSARRVAAAADASALAAADTASGALPGVPCEAAESVASLNGVRVERCDVHGAIVTIVVADEVLGLPLEGRSRAGPPSAQSERHGVGGAGDD